MANQKFFHWRNLKSILKTRLVELPPIPSCIFFKHYSLGDSKYFSYRGIRNTHLLVEIFFNMNLRHGYQNFLILKHTRAQYKLKCNKEQLYAPQVWICIIMFQVWFNTSVLNCFFSQPNSKCVQTNDFRSQTVLFKFSIFSVLWVYHLVSLFCFSSANKNFSCQGRRGFFLF